jgi:DNA-binding response OmpR family regulator
VYRILIVDDEQLVCNILTKILEKDGHQVVGVERGNTALETFRKNPFDLVITDLMLPDRGGLDVVWELHRDFPETRFIVTSGSGHLLEEDFITKAKDVGADEVLLKPFRPTQLIEKVHSILCQ